MCITNNCCVLRNTLCIFYSYIVVYYATTKGTETNTSKALTSGSIVDIIVYVRRSTLLAICIYMLFFIITMYMSLVDVPPTPENLEWILEA